MIYRGPAIMPSIKLRVKFFLEYHPKYQIRTKIGVQSANLCWAKRMALPQVVGSTPFIPPVIGTIPLFGPISFVPPVVGTIPATIPLVGPVQIVVPAPIHTPQPASTFASPVFLPQGTAPNSLPMTASPNSLPMTASPNTQHFELFDIEGIVTKFDWGKGGQPTVLKIYSPNLKANFDVITFRRVNVREGDFFYATCKRDRATNKLHLDTDPFVELPVNKDAVVKCLMRSLQFQYVPSVRLYERLSQFAGADANVVPFLTGASQQYHDTRHSDVMFHLGLEPEQVGKLFDWWHRERSLRRLLLLGLTKTEINAARMTCDGLYQQAIRNPFTVPAISMEKCISICQRIRREVTKDDRERGEIVRLIWRNLHERGWTATPTGNLVRQYANLKDHAPALKSEYGVIPETIPGLIGTVYLGFPHKVEIWMAKKLSDMIKSDAITYHFPLDQLTVLPAAGVVPERTVLRASAAYTKNLSIDQQKAIQGALDHTLCIITGAAGTGKTTCIEQIVHNLELRGVVYALCSFTGKAVARIREVTGKRKASTIHRLIANSKRNGIDRPSGNYEQNLPSSDYDYVIVDETSMVTMELMYDFLQAYPRIKHLVFVGDVNQLPPIGWGSLLLQLMKAKVCPTYRLTTNYRVFTTSKQRDGVILNANSMIEHDKDYPFEFEPTNNFTLIEGPVEQVYSIIQGAFASGIPAAKLVVLTPYNSELDALNRTFQGIYNRNSPVVTDKRGVHWAVGDRVMLTENDADIDVFNGETGFIKEVDDKKIFVDFGQSGVHDFLLEPSVERKVWHNQSFTDKYSHHGAAAEVVHAGNEGDEDTERTVKRLIHAYALTVDKSQGSEWDYVIFYIPFLNKGAFVNRNRIYTAITRTKAACWVVCPNLPELCLSAVKVPSWRCEGLAVRLGDLPKMEVYALPKGHQARELGLIGPEMTNEARVIESEIPDDDDFDPDHM